MTEGSEFPGDSANYTSAVPGIVSKAVTNQRNELKIAWWLSKAGRTSVVSGRVFWNCRSPKPIASIIAFLST